MIKNKIIKNILFFLLVNFLIFFNLSWHIIANPTLNLINIILGVLLWTIVSNPQGHYWPHILYTVLVNDLFEKTSFGITALAMIITLVFVHWVLLNIFTNRSLITVFLSGLGAAILYRVLFVIFIFLRYSSAPTIISSDILKIFFIESILTAVVLSFGYLISAFFVKHLHPEYVNRGHIL